MGLHDLFGSVLPSYPHTHTHYAVRKVTRITQMEKSYGWVGGACSLHGLLLVGVALLRVALQSG